MTQGTRRPNQLDFKARPNIAHIGKVLSFGDLLASFSPKLASFSPKLASISPKLASF